MVSGCQRRPAPSAPSTESLEPTKVSSRSFRSCRASERALDGLSTDDLQLRPPVGMWSIVEYADHARHAVHDAATGLRRPVPVYVQVQLIYRP
jgi:hypothetical protein